MKTSSVNSYKELVSGISSGERAFLLLYKRGADQSDCAFERIKNIDGGDSANIFTADVNVVRDIHERLEISTAPSLVVFEKNRMVNIIRGCQTESAYDSILSGREIGVQSGMEKEKGKQLTVYTTPTCTWCTTLKTYLDQNQVPYREINVAADTSAAEAMVRKSGQQGVPQTEINGQMIVGFDKNRINQLLEIK
jgi:glutaredoxin-like YruB-family protein